MADPFRDPQPQTLDSVSHRQSRAARENDDATPPPSRNAVRRADHVRTPAQNPFADPAVQAGLHSNAHEEYESSFKAGGSTYSLPQTGGGGEDMQTRLADLQRREQELAVRPSVPGDSHRTQERLCSDVCLQPPLTRSCPPTVPGIGLEGEAGAYP